jgi:UDP-N-acetylglucosamine acyltransferase
VSDAARIPPHAVVDPRAVIGPGVEVGPFVVVEGDVEVGAGAVLLPGTVLLAGTRIGAGARVGPHAVIGGTPMDARFRGEPSGVDIGARSVLREHVTVHRATGEGERTTIGDDALVMVGVHVSHNGRVGDRVVLTNAVQLGGHVEVGDDAVLGAGASLHQFVRVGRGAMLGAVSGFNRDVLPFAMARGNPARHYRLNAVGLRRRGVTGDRYRALEQALRAIRHHEDEILSQLAATWPEVAEMRDFMAASRRGTLRFVTDRRPT